MSFQLRFYSNEHYYVSLLHFSSGLHDRYKPWHVELDNWTQWQRRKENVTKKMLLGEAYDLLCSSNTVCQHQQVSTMVYTVIPAQLLQKTLN